MPDNDPQSSLHLTETVCTTSEPPADLQPGQSYLQATFCDTHEVPNLLDTGMEHLHLTETACTTSTPPEGLMPGEQYLQATSCTTHDVPDAFDSIGGDDPSGYSSSLQTASNGFPTIATLGIIAGLAVALIFLVMHYGHRSDSTPDATDQAMKTFNGAVQQEQRALTPSVVASRMGNASDATGNAAKRLADIAPTTSDVRSLPELAATGPVVMTGQAPSSYKSFFVPAGKTVKANATMVTAVADQNYALSGPAVRSTTVAAAAADDKEVQILH